MLFDGVALTQPNKPPRATRMLFDDEAICLAGELRLASKRQAETDAKKMKRTASTLMRM